MICSHSCEKRNVTRKVNSVQTGFYLGFYSGWIYHVSFINLTECILRKGQFTTSQKSAHAPSLS